MAITFDGVTKRFGDLTVFEDLDFRIGDGEFVALVGPSGCGKSTVLNLIADLVSVDGGTIDLDGDDRISYVFQSPHLLNWRTVEQNFRLVLKNVGVPPADHDALIDEYLDIVGLEDVRHRYPRQLSGGMQSRVNLVRGLMVPSSTVLMDEPLGDVDELTARTIREELLELWARSSGDRTIVYVTHDLFEATYLSDRILVMDDAPSSILADIEVDVPRPRDVGDDRLFHIENEVYETLSG